MVPSRARPLPCLRVVRREHQRPLLHRGGRLGRGQVQGSQDWRQHCLVGTVQPRGPGRAPARLRRVRQRGQAVAVRRERAVGRGPRARPGPLRLGARRGVVSAPNLRVRHPRLVLARQEGSAVEVPPRAGRGWRAQGDPLPRAGVACKLVGHWHDPRRIERRGRRDAVERDAHRRVGESRTPRGGRCRRRRRCLLRESVLLQRERSSCNSWSHMNQPAPSPVRSAHRLLRTAA
mmetsp:Transcript_35201/g.104399  ORF Transcript_35201/g.104399 Transcript_35201/m.104399 type:complete len:233 (-) Transcript_35201:63-761(-)